jgi:hypothetical protein
MINRVARTPPEALDPGSTANLIWAVAGRADDGGHRARIFAGLAPPPPIQWLFELEHRDHEERERHEESLKAAKRDGRAPSIVPTYQFDTLFPSRLDDSGGGISDVGYALMPWLLRYMADARLAE